MIWIFKSKILISSAFVSITKRRLRLGPIGEKEVCSKTETMAKHNLYRECTKGKCTEVSEKKRKCIGRDKKGKYKGRDKNENYRMNAKYENLRGSDNNENY